MKKKPRRPKFVHPRHLQCKNWMMKTLGPVRISWCKFNCIEVDAGGVARGCFDKETVKR